MDYVYSKEQEKNRQIRAIDSSSVTQWVCSGAYDDIDSKTIPIATYSIDVPVVNSFLNDNEWARAIQYRVCLFSSLLVVYMSRYGRYDGSLGVKLSRLTGSDILYSVVADVARAITRYRMYLYVLWYHVVADISKN